MATLEEFAAGLKQRIAEQAGRSGYMMSGALVRAIDQAMQGQDAAPNDYPRMLYRDGGHFMVNDAAAESAALAAGFSRNAPAQFAGGFPKTFTEKPTSLGGRKAWDLRSVMLRTPDEEREFLAVVEEEDWIADDQRSWGGRGIALSELVEERKTALKAMIDAEELEVLEPSDLTAAQNAEEGAGETATPGAPSAEQEKQDDPQASQAPDLEVR